MLKEEGVAGGRHGPMSPGWPRIDLQAERTGEAVHREEEVRGTE